MDIYLGVALILFCLWFYRANRGILFLSKDPSSPLPLPPGSMGWPFYGNTREVETAGYTKTVMKQVEKYGRVSKTFYFGDPVIVFAGKELAKIFHLGENKTVQKSFSENIADLLGRESILCSTGRLHSKLRGLILKSFTPRQVEAYVPVIEKVARKYIQKWDEAADLGKTQMAQEDFLDLAFEVVATTMLGREPEMLLVNKYHEWARGLNANKLNFPGTQYTKSMNARKFILQYIEKIILEKQSEMRKNPEAKATTALEFFLTTAYDSGEKMSMDQMKDQLLILMFAGHSTTSGVLCVCIGEVWRDEDLVEKLYQEQLSCRPDPDEPFSIEQLRQMPLLHKTMWEAIRSVPPLSILRRRVIKTFEVDGYQIPKGWLIYLAVNHNMKTFNNFTNKSEFDPGRFDLGRNEGVKADYAFKPFGAGKRSCVGEPLAWHEMQIFLSLLIRSYKWKAMNYPPPYNTPVFVLVSDGLPVKIEKRAAK